MEVPWRPTALTSLVTSYFIVSRQTAAWSTGRFSAIFVGLWLAQLFLYGIWAVLLYPLYFSPLIGLPEPPGGSFLNGHFKKIREMPTGHPQREWIATVPNDGVIRYRGFLNHERLFVTSPKALAEVLVTRNYDFEKPSQVRRFLGRILGVGVLIAEGDLHKVQRRNLMPAFAFRHVKDLYPVFWKLSREAVQVMTESVRANPVQQDAWPHGKEGSAPIRENTGVIEVGSWASRTTLDIIGVTGMGRSFGAIQDPNNELRQTYRSVFQPSRQAQILELLGMILPSWIITNLPVRRNNDINAAAKVIKSVCYDLIREKKDKNARKELTDVDILSVAIESGFFTDEDLANQLMTFLAAGHETTASALTWGIYMMARYPDVQRRLRDEVRANLPPLDSDEPVASAQIDRLPYLNAVCSEVLRYYSPVPLTVRESVVDTSILGHRVPRGTRVVVVPGAINLDPELWGPDAAAFNPDRWMPRPGAADDKAAASGGAASNYAFMTFLHGPRSCIGSNFAKAEFACLLATWIGRFEFDLFNKEEHDEAKMLIKGGVTARPANGLHVYATALDGW